MLTGPEATRANILKGLDKLKDNPDPKKIVVIFLAGHGQSNQERGDYYFLPHDTAYTNNRLDTRSLISLSELSSRIGEIKARKILMISGRRS